MRPPTFALSAVILAALVAAPAVADDDGADEFLGRWNVRITDATDTFASGGFRIDEDGHGLSAGVVWRWGSYLKASSVTLEDGTLRMVREETPGKKELFEVRAEDGALTGKVTYPDGKVHHFEGRRAPDLTTAAQTQWGEPVSLFDGKTLDGWRLRDPKAKMGWAVVDGELAVVEPKGNADLVSDRSFQDMKLHVEWKVEPHSNSGVYLRGRYEIQVIDDPKLVLESHGCGALYSRVAPRLDATKGPGEWQAYDITFVGRRLEVKLNGQTIVSTVVDGITGGAISPWEEEPAPLMLQGDHGKVRFRNIEVTPAR
jgi:hypothetical protein